MNILNEMDLRVFAERIKELREEKGLTSADLARALNRRTGVISKWELSQRMPKADSLFKLAQFFGVSIDYLVGLSDE
ncbi:MAG: helix-turn-helix domain-containing protein [Firmicutes bacterium]|nr:helix-turn-helix domain-containing protein [Bacillota bacterium]